MKCWRFSLALALVLTAFTAFSVAFQPPTPAYVPLSQPVEQVMQLLEANVRPEVVISYIQNSPVPYNLTPDEIIELDSQGTDPNIIQAMFLHDRELRDQAAANNTATAPPPFAYPPPTPPVPQPETEIQPAPDNSLYTNEMSNGYPDENAQSAGFFSGSLAPYGSWDNSPGQGWCWQPSCAKDSQWKPYCDNGQWCFTDCGWYWNSKYPWGWACFHYGRWQNDPKKGWRWFPGKTWAPSWVTWRDSGKCIGWAALPPGSSLGKNGLLFKGKPVPPSFGFGLRPDCFTFVLPRFFGSRNLGNSRLGWMLATRLFPDTRAFNNLVRAPNGLVMNPGLDVNLVAGDSENPIPRAHLSEVRSPQEAGFVPGQNGAVGTVSLYRPTIGAPAPTPSTSINPALNAHTFLPGGQPSEIAKPGPAPTPSTSINQAISGPTRLPGQPQSLPVTQGQQAAQEADQFRFNNEFPKILPVHPGPPFAPAGTRSVPFPVIPRSVGAPHFGSGGGGGAGHGGGGGGDGGHGGGGGGGGGHG